MKPTQKQIKDALEHLDSGDISWNMWLMENSDIIRHCLQSALDTQKPAGDAALVALDRLESGVSYNRANDCWTIRAALAGDCGGGDHPPIEGLEAAINNSIMYPMVNDVGFQSEHDRRMVMQAARRYLALTADNAKRGDLLDALETIHDLTDKEIKARFKCSDRSESECGKGSVIYSLLSVPRNIARSAIDAHKAALTGDCGGGDLVHTVYVVEDDFTHIFSTEKLAREFADTKECPCVISTYLIDNPERFYEAVQ